MLRVIIVAASILGLASCTDRTETHSDAGRDFARHLCTIQNGCNCDDETLIPSCENRVEREFAESERKAVRGGLNFDPECMEEFLQDIDGLQDCGLEYFDDEPPCPVYHADADVDDPCEVYDAMPRMNDCRVGLVCIQGTCRDPENPAILPQGAMCTTVAGPVPTPYLGTCDAGLQCDTLDTLTCIPATSDPAPLGGACTHALECLDGNICRPQGDDLEPSDERPGVCVERTPPGEPCTLTYECDRTCDAGICQVPPPVLCEALRYWSWLREFF